MTYYDLYGWLTDTVIAGRSTTVAPPPKESVPEGYKPNWSGIAWVVIPYTPPPEPEEQKIEVTVPGFYLLMTSPERVAFRASVDPVIKDWMALLEDQRLLTVDLNDPTTRDGLLYATSIGILAAGRADRILAGLRPE